ncbi:MAG: sulfite exporter TauE/SafE family protein [Pseudomonadota bacterium]
MITEPLFYVVAIPAIILTGLAKGGFLSGLGGLAVPLMALVISPIQAAGIMLPILIVMDLIGVVNYRKEFDRANVVTLLPAAIVGVAAGYLLASHVSEAQVRLLVGLIGFAFALDYFLKSAQTRARPRPPNTLLGRFWGFIAGFTSFISHTGAPPFQIYMLPQRLPNAVLAATAIVFFATINWIKVVPYAALGQFTSTNLWTAACLLPLAPLSIGAGIWLTRNTAPGPFYTLTYASLLIISVKLIYDGAAVSLFAQ